MTSINKGADMQMSVEILAWGNDGMCVMHPVEDMGTHTSMNIVPLYC